MDAVLALLGLWVLFAGSHMALSSLRIRPRLVRALGERGFQAAYSVLALAIFVPLVMLYMAHKHEGALLWAVSVGPSLRAVLYAGNAIAFVLLAGGLVTPSPVMPGSPYTAPRGAHLITRHGVFMGTGLWALMHLVPNGFATDVVFFGGFVVFALVGCWHQDRRKLASGDERFREFWERTPFFPFTGRETWRGIREFSPLALVLGLAVAILLRAFHAKLFGA